MQQIMTLITQATAYAFPSLLELAASAIALRILTRVIKKAPKARDPKLVIEAHLNPSIISADPSD